MTIDYNQAYEQWESDYPLRGMALFEALPDVFTFDQLMHTADLLEISSLEAVEHLRIMEREQMIEIVGTTFLKAQATVAV